MKLSGVGLRAGVMVAVLVVLVATGLHAADTPSRIAPVEADTATITVEEVRFRGLRIWSRGDLRELLAPLGLPGGPMSVDTFRQRVDRALKRLQEEGLFSDVRVGRAGNVLVFNVEEYARVTRIRFAGNESFDRSRLLDVLLLQPGDPANPSDLNQARRDLQRYYRDQGYPEASVTRSVSRPESGEAVVTFRVREGSRLVVNDAELIYVDKDHGPITALFRNWSLGLVLPIKPGDPYSEESLERAKRIIQQWYSTKGYLDARVETRLWRNLREGGLDVVFRIEEGVQYHLGSVRFRGNQLFGDTELRSQIPLSRGEVFNARTFIKGLEDAERLYHRRGYIDARTTDRELLERHKNPDRRRVDYTIQVREGQPVIVEAIEIHGNDVTYERVIRREITLEPGKRLDGDKRENSLRRLRNLGYFDSVEMHVDPGSAPHKRIVRVQVEEGRTGRFQFGGGFSSSSGFVGNLSVRKDNFSLYDWRNRFTGRGESLNVSSSFGQTETNFNLSWQDPWFNDDLDEPGPSPDVPILFGWRLFNRTSQRGQGDDFSSSLGWDETRRGGRIQTGRSFGPARFNRMDVDFSYQQVKVSGLNADNFQNLDPENRPLSLIREASITGDTSSFERDISSLTFGVQRDVRNQARFPTEGYFTRLSTEVATDLLGGNSNYYLPRFETRSYWPFLEPTFWAFRFNYRTIDSWEDENPRGNSQEDFPIPEFQTFFLGGQRSIRGYEFRDVAVYSDTGVLLGGGRTAFHASLEFRVKVVENTMQAFLFGDVGNVYENAWELNPSNLKQSTGLGVRIRTPMGPVNITWAQRLEETFPGAADDGESRVDFTIGAGF